VVAKKTNIPKQFALSQNYPNPFNPKTVIRYTVRAQNLVPLQHVDLSIYNILGQKVATLVNKKQLAGSYQVEWDASDVSSGVYYYRLVAEEYSEVKKMVVIK
jgi:flagellar hook assembly protein FlgD